MTMRSNRVGQLVDELLEACRVQHVGRIRWRGPGWNRPEIVDDRSAWRLLDRRLANEDVRDASVADAAEDAMQARPAQIAVDDADALAALSERDRDAARDRGLAFAGAALVTRSFCTAGPGFMNIRFVRTSARGLGDAAQRARRGRPAPEDRRLARMRHRAPCAALRP